MTASAPPTPDRTVTPAQFATALGVGRMTIVQLIQIGVIPVRPDGNGHWRISPRELGVSLKARRRVMEEGRGVKDSG